MNGQIYFESFGIEYILKEILKMIVNKSVTTNIYRIQANNSMIFDTFILDLLLYVEKQKLYSLYQSILS